MIGENEIKNHDWYLAKYFRMEYVYKVDGLGQRKTGTFSGHQKI